MTAKGPAWPRANEPWTRTEDDRLLRLFREAERRWPKDVALGRYSFKSRIGKYVARELGRTLWAVLARDGTLRVCRCRAK